MVVVLLLALGSAWDLWRAFHPEWSALPASRGAAAGESVGPDSGGEGAREPDSGLTSRPSERSSGSGAGSRPAALSRTIKSAPAQPIDLNLAGSETLHELPGIGPVLAGRILEYRRAAGRFETVEELKAVRGIGPRLFERIRPYVRVRSRDRAVPAAGARPIAVTGASHSP